MTDQPSYTKVPRSTINRYKPRGKYDYETIHSIVNTVPVVHVSFQTPDPTDTFPATIPMIAFMALFENPSAALNESLDLYLHGYISSRLMKLGGTSPSDEEEGLPVTVAATHFDGIVLALTPNNHSYNYRSAVLHGYATPVTDVAEKVWAMEQITNGVVPDRWVNSRIPPNKTEMTSTQILKVRIVDASAKVRNGTSHDDRGDMKDDELRSRTWVGVVPAWTAYGDPVPSPENRVAKLPEHITSFVKSATESNKAIAKEASVE